MTDIFKIDNLTISNISYLGINIGDRKELKETKVRKYKKRKHFIFVVFDVLYGAFISMFLIGFLHGLFVRNATSIVVCAFALPLLTYTFVDYILPLTYYIEVKENEQNCQWK